MYEDFMPMVFFPVLVLKYFLCLYDNNKDTQSIKASGLLNHLDFGLFDTKSIRSE